MAESEWKIGSMDDPPERCDAFARGWPCTAPALAQGVRRSRAMRGMRGATFVRKNGKGLCGKARQPFTCRGLALQALARNGRLTLGKKVQAR
ncbi:protein of unknown function (plasmid) [Cupriavidus taiwanensis]|nr:protein of unknown function [Cupriavidus taiwanensis]